MHECKYVHVEYILYTKNKNSPTIPPSLKPIKNKHHLQENTRALCSSWHDSILLDK